MDTARSPKQRRLTDYFTKLPSILQNHSISRPGLGGTSLLTYRVVHPVQSKDRDVAPRLLLSRLVEAVSRLVEEGKQASGSEESGDSKRNVINTRVLDGHRMTVMGVSTFVYSDESFFNTRFPHC